MVRPLEVGSLVIVAADLCVPARVVGTRLSRHDVGNTDVQRLEPGNVLFDFLEPSGLVEIAGGRSGRWAGPSSTPSPPAGLAKQRYRGRSIPNGPVGKGRLRSFFE